MTSVSTDSIYDPASRIDPRGISAQFLTTILAGKSRVLDAAAGNGCDSAMLFRHGHAVVCNEINASQLAEAKHVADEVGAELEFTSYRWETLNDMLDPSQKFDAIIVTRNAFAMTELSEQPRAIGNFVSRLNPGGVLLVDERSDGYSSGDTDSYAPHPFVPGQLHFLLQTVGKPVDVYSDYDLETKNQTVKNGALLTTYVLHNA